jgi:hypothetical protein
MWWNNCSGNATYMLIKNISHGYIARAAIDTR